MSFAIPIDMTRQYLKPLQPSIEAGVSHSGCCAGGDPALARGAKLRRTLYGGLEAVLG